MSKQRQSELASKLINLIRAADNLITEVQKGKERLWKTLSELQQKEEQDDDSK